MKTTIAITNKEILDKLNELKVHPKQPYEEIIMNLIKEHEEIENEES